MMDGTGDHQQPGINSACSTRRQRQPRQLHLVPRCPIGRHTEPDINQRASVMALIPQTYYWQGSWNPSSFRLVIKPGGIAGNAIYDHHQRPGAGPHASTFFAYLGNSARAFTETGSAASRIATSG